MAKAKPSAKTKRKSTPKAKSTKPRNKPHPRSPGAKSSARSTQRARATPPAPGTLRALRSVIYQVDDLAAARAFYAAALGREPYFDQPFYVGFDLDGRELGLDPDVSKFRPGPGGAIAYWRVDTIAGSWNDLLALGGSAVEAPHEVGGGLQMAVLADPCGNLVGLIETPPEG